MTDFDLPAVNAALTELLRERLGIRRGKTLRAKLASAGRLIPRAERMAGRKLVDAEVLWANPKLRRQLNQVELSQAETRLRAWLEKVDLADRRKGVLLGILGSLAFNFLLLAALGIGWAWYSGWL